MSLSSLLGLAAFAAAAAVIGRWTRRRTDGLGRPRDLPVWSLVLLVSLGVAFELPVARRHLQERQLESVASRLVGHRVAVHCQTNAAALIDMGQELGWVRFDLDGVPEPQTLLKRQACHGLRSYAKHRTRPSEDEVIAVHVLTHEAMHMRGETQEAVTECQALQRDADTARMLGATAIQARRLARTYWLVVYPTMSDDYRSTACGPGKALDEGLVSAPWAP